MFKTYWDHTERERSALTREQVESLLDHELMERGVIKVVPPVIQPVEPEPTMQREMWYGVGGLLFRTAEDAAAVLKMNPHKEGYNWSADYKYKYAEPIDQDISQSSLYVRSEVDAFAKILAKNKQVNEANAKASELYAKAAQDQDKVLDALWGDWQQCREKAQAHQRVIDTRQEYIRLAGDPFVAETFLRKAFNESQIDAADKWFEISREAIQA